jgi:hypothetical protein
MRKTFFIAFLILSSFQTFSQNGLENIVVEKYYISNENDATVNSSGGILPVGSVTYRIYVDMAEGYKLQAIYGVPGHEMRIATSTLFFNNEDRGATTPGYTKSQARNNTVMLDSWLSVGAACAGNFGVLKTEDDGIATNVNADGVLQNNDANAGIPLTQQDGLLLGTPQPVTTLGLDNIITVFDNQNDGTNGPLFSTSDGAWSALSGATGPTASNSVLIAQITTNGILSFALNVQLGTPSGGVERFVATNPVALNDEFIFPGLTFTSDSPTKNLFVDAEQALFRVFPNPAGETLFVQLNSLKNEIGRYSIYDLKGQLVAKKTLGVVNEGQIETIDISQLSNGQYFMDVVLNGKRYTEKFIKN